MRLVVNLLLGIGLENQISLALVLLLGSSSSSAAEHSAEDGKEREREGDGVAKHNEPKKWGSVVINSTKSRSHPKSSAWKSSQSAKPECVRKRKAKCKE